MTAQSKTARTVSGRVVSNKMNETITVSIDRKVMHALYGKYISRRTKLHAHDAGNQCNEGDIVLIEECRPISKSKSWRLVKVLEETVKV